MALLGLMSFDIEPGCRTQALLLQLKMQVLAMRDEPFWFCFQRPAHVYTSSIACEEPVQMGRGIPIHKCTYLCTYTDKQKHSKTHTNMYNAPQTRQKGNLRKIALDYVCIHTTKHWCMRANTHTCTHTQMHKDTYTQVQARAHTQTNDLTNVHTYKQTKTNTSIHHMYVSITSHIHIKIWT